MQKRIAATGLLMIMVIGITAFSAKTQEDTEFSRPTLKGITGLMLFVEPSPPGAQMLGLNKDVIQTEIELKLRLAGIRVLTQRQGAAVPGSPILYVSVDATKDAVAASIEVELMQDTRLVRNFEATTAATWSHSFYSQIRIPKTSAPLQKSAWIFS